MARVMMTDSRMLSCQPSITRTPTLLMMILNTVKMANMLSRMFLVLTRRTMKLKTMATAMAV